MIQYLCFIGGDNIPTTTKITKEMILNVAFQITKTDGNKPTKRCRKAIEQLQKN